jgi:hypothetical protein
MYGHIIVETIALGLTLALALTIASSTAASGDGNCATRNEYYRIHEGMWRHRVTLIFGFVGVDRPAGVEKCVWFGSDGRGELLFRESMRLLARGKRGCV